MNFFNMKKGEKIFYYYRPSRPFIFQSEFRSKFERLIWPIITTIQINEVKQTFYLKEILNVKYF